MSTKDTNTTGATTGSPLRPLAIIAFGVIALIGIGLAFGDQSTLPETANADSEVVQRPTGAGTNPDGVVDETVEGLSNETTTDDFLNSSAASNTSPLGGVETNDGPEPAASASNVDSAVENGTDPVERMIENTTD